MIQMHKHAMLHTSTRQKNVYVCGRMVVTNWLLSYATLASACVLWIYLNIWEYT